MSTTTTQRHLATLDQAAEYVGTSARTVRRMIARGDIAGYRLPGRSRGIRVDLNEIDAVLLPVPTSTASASAVGGRR